MCLTRIIRFYQRDGKEIKYNPQSKLRENDFVNGTTHTMIIKFIRALCFHTEEEYELLIRDIENHTNYKYPREIIIQAMNMAPECTKR